jgi:hypothetical protein
LTEIFLESGLDRDKLYIVNAVACVPKEPRRDREMKKAVACCRPLLLSYIRKLPVATPTMVLGAWAQLALDGKEVSIAKQRGFIEYEWDLDKIR